MKQQEAASRLESGLRSMSRLSRSVARFSWAGVLLGAQGITSRGDAAESLDALSFEARRHLSPLPQALLQAGCDLQNECLDRLPGSIRSESWRQFNADLANTASTSLKILRLDPEGTAARQELAHKLGVCALVRRASDSLGDDAATRAGFERAARNALELDSRQALWILEGIGHGHARAVLEMGGPPPRGLLRDIRLPTGASLMAHLGLGMALAEYLLRCQDPAKRQQLQAALDDFVALCTANSEPEHRDAALEALGLVVRCFFPELTLAVGELLHSSVDSSPLARTGELYWHGVGRAIYFLPLHLIPGFGALETGLSRIDAEAPHERARAEARAGFAYAATLVNLGWPLVLERFVMRSPKSWDQAFTEGVTSAILMRRQVTPDDPELAAFLAHQPTDAAAKEPWLEIVIKPLEEAFRGTPSVASAGGAVTRTLATSSTEAAL